MNYTCASEDKSGESVVFTDDFPTKDGRVNLVPANPGIPDEKPDLEYPFVLITGRQLEHWHTGSMTRRATILNAIEPGPTAYLNSRDMERLGLIPGDSVKISSRRGSINVLIRLDNGTPNGNVFMSFAYREAAANLLTNAALDPVAKIPEFKYCAVKLEKC